MASDSSEMGYLYSHGTAGGYGSLTTPLVFLTCPHPISLLGLQSGLGSASSWLSGSWVPLQFRKFQKRIRCKYMETEGVALASLVPPV